MEILNNKSKIEKIYHIGDVHVMKNNNRDEEYREVFESLYENIKKDTKNALIVCTGDVFNDGLSPSSIILVKNLFSKLSELCDIVIFRGNHDQTSRSNSETIDFLFPVLYKLESKNKIHVLGKTGSYIYGNLIFGYTDVYESVVYKIDGHNDKIKIGLWHGTINGSKIDNNNNELDGKFNQGDFKGYDYVFLGDIHKFQYLNKDKTIAYCGSTLQLNFGENILGHGYLKWDLVKKTSEHVHIKNNYGFLTLRAKNNKLEKYDKTIVPKNINLRIIYENCETDFVAKIYDDISKDHKIMSYQQEKRDSEINFTKDKEDNKDVLDEKSCIKNLINYIKKNNFDKDKDKNSDEEKVEKDNEINEMETIISEKIKEIDYKYNSEKRNIKLKSLCFNNFNVYGQDNYIDYSALKGIVNVSGQNGIGKSSLIHCILYSIYGLCEELSGKYDYINTKERELETLITLDINGVEYKIFRECKFGDAKRTEKNVTNNVIIYENGKDISGKSLPEINKQIFTIVGNPDNLKNICIMEQKRNESFLNLKDTEKTEYLFKILKLDIYNELCDSISSEVKLNNRIISSNNEKIYTDAKKKTGSKDKIIEDEIKSLKGENEELLQREKILNEKYNSVHKEKIENELKYDELREFENMENYEKNKNELENKIEKNNKEIKILQNEIDENDNKMIINKKELDKYKNIEKKNNEFEEKKTKEINGINDEINKLFEEYVKIEKNEGNIEKMKEDKSKIKKEKKEIKERRDEIENEIEELESEIEKYENTKGREEGYQKYLERTKILEEINEKKKITKMRIDELTTKNNKKEKEHKKNNQMIEDIEKKCNNIKSKIDKYGDMDKKKKTYEKNREDEINKLNEEIHKDLESYIKINNDKEINYKLVESKLKELEKEKDVMLKNQKDIDKKINDNKNKIIEIKDEKKILDNYNDYVSINDKKQKIENELELLNKKLDEYTNHLDMMKSHEYNKDCKICMKNKLTQDLINTENNIQIIQDKIKKNDKELKKILSEHKKNEKYNEEYEEYESNSKRNEELNKLIENDSNKKSVIDEKIKNIMKDIEINNSLLNEYEKKQNILKNNETIDKRLKENRKLLEKIKNKKYDEYDEYCELLEEKEDLDQELEEIKRNTAEYDKITKEINELNDVLEKHNEEEEKINKKYDKYVKYGEMYEENNKNMKTLEKKKNEFEMNNKNYEIISNKIENLNKKIEEYEKYLESEEKNKIVMSKINEKKKELKELEMKKYDDYEKYKNLNDTNNKLSKQIMENKLKSNNLENVNEKMKRELNDIMEIAKKIEIFNKIKAKCEKINNEYKNISNEMEEFVKEKNKNMTRIIELTNDLKNIKLLIDENKKLKKEYNLKSKIIDIIKDGYIDNLLTNNIIPELSTSVNNILESFVNYKIHMEYNNKKITVYKKDKDGMLSNASKLSGYETLMANISFRLAMNNKNKLQKTNFFIIDEGFAFCDDQSIPKISNLFTYMRQIYDFVIIISHDEQIKMYTDMNLQIKHKDGYSYARFSNDKNVDIMNKNIELMNLHSSKKKAKDFKIKKEFNNYDEDNNCKIISSNTSSESQDKDKGKSKIKKLVKIDKSKKIVKK
jgi:DNA repair exonuclease SbcCD ATPase subunit/DNA repair exonuclease SbcCD nuclease subunit